MLGFDRDIKTVRIPVTFTGGRITLLDGRLLPKIQDGSCGELLLNEYAVMDKELVAEWCSKATVEMVPAGAVIALSLMADRIPRTLWKKLNRQKGILTGPANSSIAVELNQPLRLCLRGTKSATLCACECTIPVLRGLKARSVNHAYTLISRHFEKDRISHSGNVFQLGYWYDEKRKRWVWLDKLRTILQGQGESNG